MVDLLSKLRPTHLTRDAYIYVRVSTLTQVRESTESLQRQYELADRAMTLGWSSQQVVIIDDDLGITGADASARMGSRTWSPMSGWARQASFWGSRCLAGLAATPPGISCSICAR
jgi:hypothetical protein